MTLTHPPVFFLLAPTAAGKTALSIALAQRFDFEIINADAYQCFRLMDIGTAKPTPSERARVPHHLFDIKNPDQSWSAHAFARMAHEAIIDIASRGKRPLLVGGSGFYARAFMTKPSQLPEGTLAVQNYQQAFGEILQQDPALADQMHPHDHYRIERAAFLLSCGIMPSQAWQQEQKTQIENPCHMMTITWDRDALYEKINARTSLMVEQGLVRETQQILSQFPHAKTRLEKTIGYQQALQFLDGAYDEEEMKEIIARKTRNYAKRQMTWIRNQLDPATAHFENAFETLSCYIKEHTS